VVCVSMGQEVGLSIQNNVAVVTLLREKRGNSLTNNMILELLRTFEQIETDNSVRVVILTGNGKYFCTGMDLSAGLQAQEENKNSNSESGNQSPRSPVKQPFIELLERIRNLPKPVVCRINGPAMGGGLGLIFATDVRLSVPSMHVSFPEVKRGIIPAMISAYIVPELGIFRSRQLMLTGQRVSAQEFFQMGVLSGIAENDSMEALDRLVDVYVKELLSSGPNAMAKVKNLIRYVSTHSHSDNLSFVEQEFNQVVQSEEASYGMGCFLRRETPDWSTLNAKM